MCHGSFGWRIRDVAAFIGDEGIFCRDAMQSEPLRSIRTAWFDGIRPDRPWRNWEIPANRAPWTSSTVFRSIVRSWKKAAEIKYRKGKVERDGSIWIEVRDIERITRG